MEKVGIGHSEVKVSPIGLGTNAVGGHNLYPDLDEEKGKAVVRAALQNNINFLDTAYIYGEGRSEELIGEAIKGFKREDIVIATKAAHVPNATRRFDNSPKFLEKSVDDALSRLQTDYLDIFYIHFPDDNTPKSEAIETLAKMKTAGKIRAIGVSNFSLIELEAANENHQIDVVQDEYNLLNRHNENDLMEYCFKHHISFIPYFPLASGLLTGKYNTDTSFPEGDLRRLQENFQGKKFIHILERVEELKNMALSYHVSVTELVLAWYLKHPWITAVIPGAKTPEQVIVNSRAQTIELSNDDYQKIDELFPIEQVDASFE